MARVKRAYKYRFYPTAEQAAELSRTFGCVRLVYNRALEERTRAWYTQQRRISYVQSSAMLTAWKQSEELAFLNEVSSVPLQQALRHLQTAFVAFWNKRAKYPTFKRKKAPASAEYTRSAFAWRDGRLTLAKTSQSLDIHWSRPLPGGAEPTTASVSRDTAGRWFVSLLVEDLAVCILVGLPLNVRERICDCGTTHDRDVNAARNILAAGLAVSACGTGVRPQQETCRRGRSAAKQEPLEATSGILHL